MWAGDFRDIADTANFIIVHPEGLLDNTGLHIGIMDKLQ